jgi:acetyl-CoA C-acetyltransferase
VHTVASDGLFGLATAVMLIRSGVASTVAVEAHSKASDVVSHGRIDRFAMDPVLNRPLGPSATALAGLEMRRWLHLTGRSTAECADVAVRNREHAKDNPRASYAELRDPTPTFDPLTREQTAPTADGCVVLVLANEDRTPADAVGVEGVGWSQDAPSVESRDWDRAAAAERAARAAYGRAGVEPGDVDLVEVDDTFAYKQLQHLDALGLEDLDPDRVNRSGGALGEGHLREANGLARALAVIEGLRAGDAHVGVAQSWRGVPSTSAAVAVMRR